MRDGICQGCPYHVFLEFYRWDGNGEKTGTDIGSNKKPSVLEYAKVFTIMSEDPVSYKILFSIVGTRVYICMGCILNAVAELDCLGAASRKPCIGRIEWNRQVQLRQQIHLTYWSYIWWSDFVYAEGSIDSHQFEAPVASAWYPILDHKLGIHGSNSVSVALRLRNMVVESTR